MAWPSNSITGYRRDADAEAEAAEVVAAAAAEVVAAAAEVVAAAEVMAAAAGGATSRRPYCRWNIG